MLKINAAPFSKVILILILLTSKMLWAQKPKTFDPVLNKIINLKNDTNQISTFKKYVDTAMLIWEKHPDQMFSASSYFRKQSLNIRYEKGIAYCSIIMSTYFLNVKGDYVSSLNYAQESLAAAKKSGYKTSQARALNKISEIYYFIGENELVTKYQFEALKIYEKLPDKNGLCLQLTAIFSFYAEIRNYEAAEKYSKRALELAKKLKSNYHISNIYYVLADMYFKKKDYPTAYRYCMLEFGVDKKTDYARGLTLGRLSAIYKNAPDSILQKLGIPLNQRYPRALAYSKEGLKLNLGILGESEMLQDLSSIYEHLGNYKGANEAYKRHILLRDSLTSPTKIKALINYKYKAEIANNEKEAKYKQGIAKIKANQQRNYLLGGIVFLLCITFFIFRNAIIQKKLTKQVTTEKERSDSLLMNILPADVAEELKTKGRADAKLFNDVTVLFADFVNFTTISELLSPQELVDELNSCFVAFDHIITTNQIEKIKTIGDAYLAVSGLPNATTAHATNAINAAIAMQKFIKERKEKLGNKTFDVRIGLNSGSVVAGIVGVKKFAYDIWGDAVNTAARMEQNSQPGKINISETTYELVKDQFNFTYRGGIEAKNKGALKMYFLS